MDNQIETVAVPRGANYLRPLGAVERYFWLSDQNSPKHFCMTVQISGETKVERWREALEQVRARHPLLRAMIARHGQGAPTFYELPGCSIPMRVVEAKPPHDWHAAVAEELTLAFPPSEAPLARTVLFHSRDSSTLVFTAHHAIADGMSIAFVMRDILTVVGGGEIGKLELPLAQETIAEAWPSGNADTNTQVVGHPGQMLDRTQGRPVVSALRLSHELSASIRRVARTRETTVHGALLAATIVAGRSLSQEWSSGPVRAISPVNLRSTLGVGDDCVVSIIFPVGAYVPDDVGALWNLAAAIRSDLAPMKSREAIARAFGIFEDIARSSATVEEIAATELKACACEMMLSNLGEAPLEARYGAIKVDALWGPSVFVGIEGEQMIGAATVGGSIHLVHTSYSPIPDLLQITETLLSRAIG
ncbi:hypothetical protein N185_36105 [Sinorhizobium sp. GW3]|nr:hypothetical protein N185_36105 [Sinorhizobium sp. GW3]